MQSSIRNQTVEFTVLGNAEALRTGDLGATALPPIRVWSDEVGKIWTLDHRRLAAFRLAGLAEVPVEWVPMDVVRRQMWKMTTQTGGSSVRLKLGDGTFIIVE